MRQKTVLLTGASGGISLALRYSPDNRRERRRLPPEQLAALLYTAVARREATRVPAAGNRLIATLGRLAPAIAEELMRRAILHRLPRG